MRKLHFDYYMLITYTEPVSTCHFTIKCIPGNTLQQKISNTRIQLFPKESYTEGTDSFGNRKIYGCVEEPHERFSFRITGDAEVGGCLYEEQQEERPGIFCYPFGLNQPGEALQGYFRSLEIPQGLSAFDQCLYLMHQLHQDFCYEKNCTDMTTTAESAWNLGRGVCQDYAHIFLALLHMNQIPARYVTGMIPGEGASHAWVEAYCNGRWYGFDPTNDVTVTDSHIRIGVGRDASDCLINRGIMWGGGNQVQTIRVVVEEI